MNKQNIKTEKQYLEKISELHNSLNKQNAKKINDELDELYNYKPIRLEWFYAKMDVLFELGEDFAQYSGHLYDNYWALKESDKFSKLSKTLIKLNERLGNSEEVERLKFELYTRTEETDISTQKYYEQFFNDFSALLINYVEDNATKEDIKRIIELSFITSDFVLATIFKNLYTAKFNEDITVNPIVSKRPNIFYFEQILKQDSHTFTVLFNESNQLVILSVIKALKELGHNIFVLSEPQNFEVDVEIDISKTLDISLESIQETADFYSIFPVQIVKNGRILGDNRLHLIDYISNTLSKENFSTVLAFNDYMLSVKQQIGSNKFLEPLYTNNMSYNTMAFGWSGDYCAYMDKLYKIDSKKLINQKPTVDFSIIIPVRNDSSDTLFHTIRTCLDINYNGKYEIVISDNSSKGNEKVKSVVDKLNDKRIKYYKPPFELSLPKSFEFACLMAKGEFLIPFGADDAILPNALNVISDVLKEHPHEEILLWKRGFYAWPGFNKTQQNQFSISTESTTSLNCSVLQSSQLWASILNAPNLMYTIPLFYINSGFKKSYLNTLLTKTGTLFNGPCQDIYTGIVNICINNSILFLDKQLTFAGMSSSSIGASFNVSKKTVSKADISTDYIYIYNDSYYEQLIPSVWNDRGTLYKSIMRAISKGLLDKSFLENIVDFKNFYINMLSLISKDGIMFEKEMELFKCSAKKVSEDFSEWFDNTYYKNNFEPVYFKETDEPQTGHSYNIGFNDKSLTLDASDFGVKNIYDAVALYKKLTGM